MVFNIQDLDSLQWDYIDKQTLLTAQGEITFKSKRYLGKVILDNQEYEIPVYAADELTDILLGSEWLEFLPLVVNCQAGVLSLG
jgi:predicted aspartyl protease